MTFLQTGSKVGKFYLRMLSTHFMYGHMVSDIFLAPASGMCYPVCGMVHIKEPLLLIDE